MAHEPDKGQDQGVTIFIDHKQYKTTATVLSAEALRALAVPPIGADRDLFLTEPGPADDRLIADGEMVELKNGMHFYTAPRSINPGGTHAAA